MRDTIFGLLMASCLLAMSACTAPPSSASSNGAQSGATPAKPAPRMSDPLPPERAVAGKVDRRCSTDADCVVKDVRNCCGMMPACVNANSPTDPAGVAEACKKRGGMSVCGFPAVEGCKCVRNECVALPPTIDPIVDPAPAPPAKE